VSQDSVCEAQICESSVKITSLQLTIHSNCKPRSSNSSSFSSIRGLRLGYP